MRSKASWIVMALLGVGAALQPGGCAGPIEDPDANPVVDGNLLTEVLTHARESVVQQELATMQERLDTLSSAVDGWAASPDDDGARSGARAAFGDAVVQWGVLEALQVGPGAPSLDSPAGQDLRDEVYSWPTVNPCRVDQETVEGAFGSAGFFDDELVNVYGLDALEHLLYAPQDNACPGQIDINADGTWDSMDPSMIAQARADYAASLVVHLEGNVAELQSQWSGAFGDDFVAGSGPYSDGQEALDDLFRATFYIEVMKDEKLAYPLGLRECGAGACPELAESQSADLSADLLRANLVGLRSVLAPEAASGFAELLEDAGEQGLADELRALIDDAEAALEPVQSIRGQVEDDDGTVLAAYDAVAALATFLEGDVATVLSLSVPAEAAGDND